MNIELKIIDLLARNPEKKFTINETSKDLKEYYSFVHRTVNKLFKDGVVLKSRVGKSYICSLNMGNEKTSVMMQLGEIEKKDEFFSSKKELKMILEDFVTLVKQKDHIVSIVLFGSYAKGTATKESDIDIFIIASKNQNFDKISKEVYAKFGKEINILAVSTSELEKQKDKEVLKEIIKNHYVLYGYENFVSMILK